MKIAAANLQMASAYAAQARHVVSERLHMWVGGNDARSRQAPTAPRSSETHLSQAGRAAQAADGGEQEDRCPCAEPRLQLLVSLVEALTGQKLRIFDGHDLNKAPADPAIPALPPTTGQGSEQTSPAGYGVEYDFHESYSENEQVSFQASGTIVTTDGKTIDFQLSLALQRSFQTESDVHLRLGDAARQKDPLVINFAGTSAQLTDTRFSFDLDADGRTENLASLAPGSGFLALDRNGNGQIDDGSELFGPASGDGFAELATLDTDGNGWIDENDPSYSKLQIWSPSAAGDGTPKSLSATGIGAIALTRVATPFQLNTADNTNLGQVRSSGLFLWENGEVGTVQQIDLTV